MEIKLIRAEHLNTSRTCVFRVSATIPSAPGPPLFWTLYICPHSNQVLHGDQTRWGELFAAEGKKNLWHECWCVICLWWLIFLSPL